jgi:hypothetical protein
LVAGTLSVPGSVEATGRGGFTSEVKSIDCSGAIEALGSVVSAVARSASWAKRRETGTERTKTANATARSERLTWRMAEFTGPDNST